MNSVSFAEICTTPNPRERQCEIKMEELFSHDIRSECEKSDGQYVEAFYRVDCEAVSSKIVLATSSAPFCVGGPCQESERQKIVESNVEAEINRRFGESGYYDCSLQYLRVARFESRYRAKNIFARPTPSPITTPSKPPVDSVVDDEPTASPAQTNPNQPPALPPISFSAGQRIHFWFPVTILGYLVWVVGG